MESTPLGCYRRGNVAGVHRKNKWGFVRKIHQETQVIRNTGSFLKITERHIFADTKNQSIFYIQYITLMTILSFRVHPLPRQEKKL